ncbi:glycosyltransferase [Flavobacterium lindanitolerans]|nr:glycosyltransferase [Flavobacterium lindanitolerans]
MELKLSIIIPVYNGEKHIEECIESLTKQTLSDCEFIFVNDGSNDKSVELIQNI